MKFLKDIYKEILDLGYFQIDVERSVVYEGYLLESIAFRSIKNPLNGYYILYINDLEVENELFTSADLNCYISNFLIYDTNKEEYLIDTISNTLYTKEKDRVLSSIKEREINEKQRERV